MTSGILEFQIESAQRRMQELLQRVEAPPEQQAVMAEALEQLSIALHELQVASEELREQNEELAAAHAAVENERQRYQDLFDFAPDGYLVTDAEGVILEANLAATTMLRVRHDFLLGKPLAVFVPAGESKAFHSLLNRVRQGQNLGLVDFRLEPHDGAPFSARLRIAPASDRNGRPVGLRWSIRDITKLKEAEEQALQAERLAGIGEMIAGLAHESRNAMQRSKACLDMLAMELRDRPTALDLVVRVQKAQNELHQIYEEVREYAAPIVLNRQWCRMDEVLHEAWHELDFVRGGREARLRETVRPHRAGQEDRQPVDLAAGMDLHCKVDPFFIGQVFRNILENSLAACPEPVEIAVEWFGGEIDGSPAIEIAIRDNGPGLTPEQRAKIFEPFYTTKTRGTGLGMVIVKRIVEAHGGRIRLGDRGGPGAELVVTLPTGLEPASKRGEVMSASAQSLLESTDPL